MTAKTDDTARTAGRGGLAVLTAKVFFILSGFIQQTLLPRVIGLDGYGAFARVLAAANIANNVVVSASIQGVSHSVAATPDELSGQTLRRTFKAHVVIASMVALVFFFFAPFYAIHYQLAPHIVRPLQIVSVVLLMYGLYAPLVGAINGQRRFTAQAGLDITYAVLRTAGLLGLGYLFARKEAGVLGACIGFALAAVIIFPIALRVAGIGKHGNAGPSIRQHLTFIAPVALGQLFLQLLMQGDITVLGHFASHTVLDAGLAGAAAQKASDEIVGVYRACQLFAFLPFQLLITMTFIMFPMLAKAKAEQAPDVVAGYVRTGNRLAFVFACLMVATISSLAPHVLKLAFGVEVGERGGEALRILVLGQGAFALFYVQTTILTSIGRERRSAMLTAIAAALVVGMAVLAGATATDPETLPLRTATATSIALGLALIVGGAMVKNVTTAFVAPLTAARTLGVLLVVIAAGPWIPYFGKLIVLAQAIAVALLTLVLLIVTGEVGRADLATIKRVVRKSP